MQKITNILWRCLAIVVALSATGADGFNTLSQALDSGMTKDIIATLAIIIVVMSLALPMSIWAYKNQNKTYAALGAIVFLTAWSVSYGFSVNRMGTNRDNEAANYSKANFVGIIAEENRLDAKQRLEKAKVILAREAVSGKGPIWKEAKNNLDQAQLDYNKAEKKVLNAGPTKHSATFEQTGYLVYLLPFVAQASGVVFFMIGFGGLNSKNRAPKRDVIQELINQPVQVNSHKDSENKVLAYLKSISEKGEWRTTYRRIEKATGVNIAFVKEHLTDLHYSRAIVIEGSTKGKGTWGCIGVKLLAES
jgi:hypothetical protein